MYSSFRLLSRYINYFIHSSNGRGHGTHSPFVFDFIVNVLNDKTHYEAYTKVEQLRGNLLKDRQLLRISDLGAGSWTGEGNDRTVASIAKRSAKPKKYGQLLYRMVQKYQPSGIIELGTSLGLTTSYLAMAAPGSKVVTMEGAPAIAAKARVHFDRLGLMNIESMEGNFDDLLLPVLDEMRLVDFAFIDGNHRYEPTIRYFEQLLVHAGPDTILVFDDIHWSKDMEKTWAHIKSHQSVKCTIDLFFIGIVFFKTEFKQKQDFSIRF